MRYRTRQEHEIIETLRVKYPVVFLCQLMDISKSGYYTGIRSKARKYTYKNPGEEHIEFLNEVRGNWNVRRPVEIVVSDMTIFKNNGRNWEWILLVDTFNNEILAHQATPIQGSTRPNRASNTMVFLRVCFSLTDAICGQSI